MNEINDVKSYRYRDLIVWQKAHELAKLVLILVKKLPTSDESKIIRRQLIRSITSIPANIAEGYGGYRGRAYRNHLVIARKSLSESDYWLFLILDIGYIDQSSYNKILSLVNETRAILNSIIDKLGEQVAKGTKQGSISLLTPDLSLILGR